MATNVAGFWEIGIGDPTPQGWITVGAYAVSAYLCWRAYIGRRESELQQKGWLQIAVLLVALGINKQLDMQSLLTQEARVLLYQLNIYQYKRELQILFIVVFTVFAFGLAIKMLTTTKSYRQGMKIACVGVATVMSFVASRAASFHHIDALLGVSFGGMSFNFLAEMTGICIIAAGALIQLKNLRFEYVRLPKKH